jgi:hypothetical protein
MICPDWNGQNIPKVHTEWDGSTFSILPVLEFLLQYHEDTIYDLLPADHTFGWNDESMNAYAWAQNAYKVTYIIPDFTRYGCLPSWFPTTDKDDRPLSPQGQVDRFLFLLDLVYGGLPDDHQEANPEGIATALLEL